MPTVDWVVFLGDDRLGIIENPSGNEGDTQFFAYRAARNLFVSLNGRQFQLAEYAFDAIKQIVAEGLHSKLSYHRRECGVFTDPAMKLKYPRG